MSDARPCPFCKGRAQIDSHQHVPLGWTIWCTECRATTREFPSREEALAAWHRRADDIDDESLRQLWRDAGGAFHGPITETGYMVEAKLLPFLRSLVRR